MQRTFTTYLEGMEAALELLPELNALVEQQKINLRQSKNPEGTIACLLVRLVLRDRPQAGKANWRQRYFLDTTPIRTYFSAPRWTLGWELSDPNHPDPAICHWTFEVSRYLPGEDAEDPEFQTEAADKGWALGVDALVETLLV